MGAAREGEWLAAQMAQKVCTELPLVSWAELPCRV